MRSDLETSETPGAEHLAVRRRGPVPAGIELGLHRHHLCFPPSGRSAREVRVVSGVSFPSSFAWLFGLAQLPVDRAAMATAERPPVRRPGGLATAAVDRDEAPVVCPAPVLRQLAVTGNRTVTGCEMRPPRQVLRGAVAPVRFCGLDPAYSAALPPPTPRCRHALSNFFLLVAELTPRGGVVKDVKNQAFAGHQDATSCCTGRRVTAGVRREHIRA